MPENYDAVVMTSHRTREAAHCSIRNYQSDELYQFRQLTLHYAKIIHGYIIKDFIAWVNSAHPCNLIRSDGTCVTSDQDLLYLLLDSLGYF